MTKQQSYVPMIGVDMLHWARLNSDPAGGDAEYDGIRRLPGLNELGFSLNVQKGSYAADNNASYASAAKLGEVGVQAKIADLPPADKADWFGYEYEDGMLLEGQMNPRYIGLMYRIAKADTGHFRYVRILKALPTPPDSSAATSGSGISFKDSTINLTASLRQCDGLLKHELDTDDPNLPEDITAKVIEENFFKSFNWTPTNHTPEA